MARPLRIELSGGLYHVTSRGDRREDIYFNDADRLAWLDILSQVCERFNWVIHAWCQMTNHYHIVVETPEGNLSKGMRQLNGVYTQYINRTHKRVGHVFQGRYKAILIEKDAYLLELSRYVVLNPVRARMVKNAAKWSWSSYLVMIGKGEKPVWLNTEWILGQFSGQRRRAIEKYIDFVREGVGQKSLWEDLQNQIYLGSERFVKRMQKKLAAEVALDNLSEVPRIQRRPVAKPLDYYKERYHESRQGMAMAYQSGDYSMSEIADFFEVHYSTVSRAVRAYERKS
jgi:putative transposase